MKTVTVKQSIDDLASKINSLKNKKYSPVFEFYIKKLNRGDKLPRGKYFKNRVAGHNPVIRDEFWMSVNVKKMQEEVKHFHNMWG